MPYFHHFLSESLTYNNKSTCSNALIKPIKQGYLLHHKKRLFSKGWRKEFVILYEDSSLVWLRDQHRVEPEGRILLRDAPDLIAASQWVSRVPHKPELPFEGKLSHAIAIGSKHEDKVEWFICKSYEELTEWMTSINLTLPPPPPLKKLRNWKVENEPENSGFRCHKNEESSLSEDFARQIVLSNEEETSSSSHYEKIDFPSDDSRLEHHPHCCGRENDVESDEKRSASHHKRRRKRKDKSDEKRSNFPIEKISSGILIGGILGGAHWSVTSWGWGMGWGWNLCDDCSALQQQDMVHPPPLFTGTLSDPGSRGDTDSQFLVHDVEVHEPAAPQFFFGDDDNDCEVDDTDVACDFGGDFGAF